MAKLILSLVLIFCINIATVEPLTDRGRDPRRSRAKTFIEVSYRTTHYPTLCIKSLAGHVNRTPNTQQLAYSALMVSLYKTRYTRSYLANVTKDLKARKAKEYQAAIDCLVQIDDSVNQLSRSISELSRLYPEAKTSDGIVWHIGNVDTWVSAALTDASSCLDEFPGHRMSKMKSTIKSKVSNFGQLTSNALALFHPYASSYGDAAIDEHP